MSPLLFHDTHAGDVGLPVAEVYHAFER
jgi:hypothetical protein